MRNNLALLSISVLLTGTVTVHRFVGVTGQQAGVGDNAYGVAQSDGITDDVLAVDIIGTSVVETGAAISAGALVQADASGRAITRTTGAILGRLAPGEVVAAVGEFVEIILIAN